MMQLHELKIIHKKKRSKRIGRGGKRGTYSGKGMKGQRSRAGARFEPIIRGLIKRYPKLRGYKFKPKNKIPKYKIIVLNLDVLEKNFDSQKEVNPKILIEKRLISKIKGRIPKVKILGKGKLTKILTIKDCTISKQAREKIEKVGGKVI